MLHIIHHFGGMENLKGKKIAMTWAYSPSYGKPLSVPQGVIGLMTRFGMDVVLAHPEGYEVMPEVEQVAADDTDTVLAAVEPLVLYTCTYGGQARIAVFCIRDQD